MQRVGWLGRMARLAALALGFAASAPSITVAPGGARAGAIAVAAADAPTETTLQTTYTSKLCEVYNVGKQLVYIALGIGILVVVVLSIGSRFRTGLFLTLVASVVIVATTDQLMGFLNKDAQFNCRTTQ